LDIFVQYTLFHETQYFIYNVLIAD